VSQSHKKVPANAGYVGIVNSNNIKVQDLSLTNNGQGVLFINTFDSTIQNVDVSDNYYGIYLDHSSSNTVSGNTVSGIIFLRDSSSNTLSGNTVSGSISLVLSSSNTISGNTVLGSISLLDCSSNAVSENTVSGNDYGIYLGSSLGLCNSNTISGNTVSVNNYGIYQYMGTGTTISGNTILGNEYGIHISGFSNTISRNTISGNGYGIYLYYGTHEIYHNNFIDNTYQVNIFNSENNKWDDGAGKGNYWSDYTGLDDGSNGRTAGDGVGDTKIPHPDVDQGNGYYQIDNYPLMDQYTNTPIGSDVEVEPGEGIIMSFSDISTAGVTTTNEVSGSPPANFKLVPTNTFYSITTTASYSGTWIIEISIPYDDTGIPAGQEANLKLKVFDETTGKWDDITTYVDTTNNIIYGETTHLSIFAIMLKINEPPIAKITGPAPGAIFEIGSSVQFTATFTDEDSQNTHTAYWRFTSQSQEIQIGGTVTESGGSGSVSNTYTFSTQGVYEVILIVIDDNGGFDITNTVDGLPAMVVIYDSEGGFVTGGGWINSPEGAYVPSSSLTGKASFGFVAKYKKGTTEPIGNTEFEFEIADLDFQSTDYDWLVVAGAMAQFKGTGTINDEGDYKFKLWATDGALVQGGGDDTFRIKIWEEDEFGVETVIYDNKVETELGGGSIVIHKT